MRARFLILTTSCLALVAAPSLAQSGPAGARGAQRMGLTRGDSGIGLGRTIESALRQRDRLGLTAEQVGELEALRGDLNAALDPIREDAAALRSEGRGEAASPEEQRELRRDRMNQQRALHARVDTITASIQAQFEQVLPPLTRRDLGRAMVNRGGTRLARGSARGVQGRRSAQRAPAAGVRARDGWRNPASLRRGGFDRRTPMRGRGQRR
jgi:hypothetical protein